MLIVSPVATHPPYRGNRQRILQIANLFRDAGWEIQLAIGRNRTITDEARDFWPVIHRLKHSPRWRPTRGDVPLDDWYTPGLGEELAALVDDQKIDVVLLHYVFHSKLLESLPRRVLKIIDTHDVFSNRYLLHSQKPYAGGFFSCSPQDEATYLSRADFVVALSSSDQEHFSGLETTSAVRVLPFIARQDHIMTPQQFLSENQTRLGTVMSANDLNLSSLFGFIEAVRRHFPHSPPFTLEVAGDIDKIAYKWFPWRARKFHRQWIHYSGVQEDLGAFFSRIDAVVAPIEVGSGMAIKFSDAIARRFPVVSTEVGSRGHPVSHPLHRCRTINDLVSALGELQLPAIKQLALESSKVYDQISSHVLRSWESFEAELKDTIQLRKK